MEQSDNIAAINVRYSKLAEKSCCLSCGGAFGYANTNTGEVCIDLGSGRGHDVLRMADAVGETGFVYGVDISDGMLTKARRNAEKLGFNNIEFIEAELEKIPIEDETADLLISNCTINHAVDKQAVWNDIYRVLKAGGRFVVSDIYSSVPVPEEFANDPEAVAECWAGAITKDEYLETLKTAGFRDITILEESDPYKKGEIEVSSFTFTSIK